MQFFKIEALLTDRQFVEENNDRRIARDNAGKIAALTGPFNKNIAQEGSIFVSTISDNRLQLCAVAFKDNFLKKYLNRYLAHIKLDVTDIYMEEVIFSSFESSLRTAYREDYIEDGDEIKVRAGLDDISKRWGRGAGWDENLITKMSREEADEASKAFLGRGAFAEELDRIFAGKDNVRIQGHPVHYLIESDSRDCRREMYRTLLGALYCKGRVHNRRYTYVDVSGYSDVDCSAFDAIYHAAEGGCMVIRYEPVDEEETMFASSERENIDFICHLMQKYRNRVLTILCMPIGCSKVRNMFYANLENFCFINLKEDLAYGDDAKGYLKYLSQKNHIRPDSKLAAKLEEGKGYTSIELQSIFDLWFDSKLRSSYYPQYKTAERVQKKLQEAAPEGTAYDKLQAMIGLESAKEVIDHALDYYKAQKLFKDRGIKQDHPAMHMCFSGSPGTAKTSVARLCAEIFKENGILEKGQMIECGRQDLVGKYVGWTAPNVQKKFREASGGVLFIDEAYSLVDYHSGSFGDEAISTIVQEMENHRDDVIVIFAGYSDKMEEFLQTNPGLRSRIAFHVPFDDYDSAQLCEIAAHIAKEKGMKISPDAEEKLRGIFSEARQQSDFGNGRFARNLIEKARMAQSSRLVKMDLKKITDEDLTTITAEDIVAPTLCTSKRSIGFCA